MTKDEATTFNNFSKVNARILESKCDDCKAYQDWYTYKRWKAQGEQVAKGQHGVRLTCFYRSKDKNGKEDKTQPSYPKVATVFCRHQLVIKK